MKNLRHMWFIAMKDLKRFTTDRASVFFFIIFPFLFIIMFNFLLKGAFNEDTRLELHMLTQESAGMSQQILSAMETKDQSLLPPGDPVIIWDKDYAEARQKVIDGKLDGFLAFPADFTQSVMAGKPVNLEIFADTGKVNTRAALNGVAQAISSRFVTDAVIVHATAQLMAENGATQAEINTAISRITASLFSGGISGMETPFLTFVTQKIGEVKDVNPSNYVIPGYLVMFVFFAAAVGAQSIVWERQNHTLERLLSSSVQKESILGGTYLGLLIKGLVQIIIFWGFGIIVFHVDMGLSPGAVILLSLLMVVMSAAFSLMLATLVRTTRSAGSLAVITSLLLAPLGGCWWPLFLYPDWLQNIAKISPHAWATEGFNKLMLFGAGFGDAVSSMVALVVFTVIFGAIAIWRFRTSDM
jgi:linearmycin/streptolysin S transport system permease protein